MRHEALAGGVRKRRGRQGPQGKIFFIFFLRGIFRCCLSVFLIISVILFRSLAKLECK